MVGELPDPAEVPAGTCAEGDELVLVGPFAPSLAGSELAKLRGELAAGLPATEIEPVAAALALVRSVVREGGVSAAPRRQRRRPGRARSPRWRSPAESGCEADLDPLVELRGCSGETALFGEGPGGIVLAAGAAEAAPRRCSGAARVGRH